MHPAGHSVLIFKGGGYSILLKFFFQEKIREEYSLIQYHVQTELNYSYDTFVPFLLSIFIRNQDDMRIVCAPTIHCSISK